LNGTTTFQREIYKQRKETEKVTEEQEPNRLTLELLKEITKLIMFFWPAAVNGNLEKENTLT
jgi:hypothetical protein